jgi:hypothetical protein
LKVGIERLVLTGQFLEWDLVGLENRLEGGKEDGVLVRVVEAQLFAVFLEERSQARDRMCPVGLHGRSGGHQAVCVDPQ